MNISDIFYKIDENTGNKRISKTKIITLIVFLIFFLIAMSIYFTDPTFSSTILLSVIAAILFGLTFAIPTFILGWIIGKFLNRDKKTNSNYNIVKNNYTSNQNNDEIRNITNTIPCPHDDAARFKKAIGDNNSDLAENILSTWDKNDANYVYAKIIFEGIPPSDMEVYELNNLFNQAEIMNSCDENLREWFKNTALQVINMNN